MKPTVNCSILSMMEFLEVGYTALVQPYNHPNHVPGHNISNNNPVRTSKIVRVDLGNKLFETRNTIYSYAVIRQYPEKSVDRC